MGKSASLTGPAHPPPAPLGLPCWCPLRRELSWGTTLIKVFRVPAENQVLILAAFQSAGWPLRIADPLVKANGIDPAVRLRAAVRRLNRCQRVPLIRFSCDGTGTGVLWQRLGPPSR